MILYNKYFQIALIASVALLWLSLLSFLYPTINYICFTLIVLATLILSWRKLEYGVYLVLAELFLTSHGHLFNFGPLSLRMALFGTVILIWLIKLFNKETIEFLSDKLKENRKIVISYLLLVICLLWGLGWGIARNNFTDAFNDFNGYLYLLLLPVFLTAFKDKQKIKNIWPVFLGSLSAMVFFNLTQLFFFTHKISNDLLWPLYRWTRVNYLGEITYAGNGFYRIFWPGQFFLIVGFFILLVLSLRGASRSKKCHSGASGASDRIPLLSVITASRGILSVVSRLWRLPPSRMTTIERARNDNYKQITGNIILASLFLSAILISFSRSFWLAMAVGLLFLLIFLIPRVFPRENHREYLRENPMETKSLFWRGLAVLALVCLLSVGIIYSTVKFPVPPTIGDFSAEMLKDRAGTFVSSRWNLLPVLSKALINHPIIGSGFGSPLTYKTEDPRLLEFFPDGNYTTYAFEWGYLELTFKIGLAGLIVYLIFIWQIFKKILAKLLASTGEEKFILIALIAGLIALLVTHNFSPYLNHPIGIGYLLLLTIF